MNRELIKSTELLNIADVSFITLTVDELITQYDTALDQLYQGEQVGFLVKNFLSQEEVASVMSGYDDLMKTKEIATTGEGFTYPMVFAEFSEKNKVNGEVDKKSCDEYFQFCSNYDSEFVSDFGFSLKAKIDNLFSKVSGSKQVDNPPGYDGVGNFPFGNFRNLEPHKGHIPFHCGNYFQSEFKPFYSHLEKSLLVVDQLSYFVMFQKPDIGGHLEVFNLSWESGQTKRSAREDKEVVLSDGERLYPDENFQCEKILVSPEPGDLILFQGGNIWHRVSQVEGAKSRVTFGGFMAVNKEKDCYYYWS